MKEIKPVRLQRKRTKGYKMSDSPNGLENIYVGRPTRWGNSFIIKGSTDRKKACESFKANIDAISSFRKLIKQKLKDKNLVCWCSLDVECHADILLKIANE